MLATIIRQVVDYELLYIPLVLILTTVALEYMEGAVRVWEKRKPDKKRQWIILGIYLLQKDTHTVKVT
jgi:hypothetical protein